MSRQIVATDKVPPALGPYLQVVREGDLLFTAGTIRGRSQDGRVCRPC